MHDGWWWAWMDLIQEETRCFEGFIDSTNPAAGSPGGWKCLRSCGGWSGPEARPSVMSKVICALRTYNLQHKCVKSWISKLTHIIYALCAGGFTRLLTDAKLMQNVYTEMCAANECSLHKTQRVLSMASYSRTCSRGYKKCCEMITHCCAH